MNEEAKISHKPEILAPAGDMQSALAALAAGADAIYLGLKHFSARMQADNFGSAELAKLIDLAHNKGRKIYVAMNTFFKPDEGTAAARMIRRVLLGPAPDAIIAQDPAIVPLARAAGYEGEIHFSTLANVTHQAALQTVRELGASRAILPRELSIDEVRAMEQAAPPGLALELFVHGALCFCVSGRCWWSSYMGGKSGLRGRCVQPCRRVYKDGGKQGRFFSCRDLSIDVLVKTLLDMPGISSWKIEGRKKGPYYVFYTTTAYRLLRDNPGDSAVKKEAEDILSMSLGRPVTRARFLPQRTISLTMPEKSPGAKKGEGHTSSGLLCGSVARDQKGVFSLKARMDLLPQDYLRIGYEDEPWHYALPVTKRVPKGGSYTLKLPKHKSPPSGTPVFLIDRREPELMRLLKEWQDKLDKAAPRLKKDPGLMEFSPPAPKGAPPARRLDVDVKASIPRGREGKDGIRPGTVHGIWLSPRSVQEISRTLFGRISWWLPPVIWPDEEEQWRKMIRQSLRNGARHFVCGAPWQAALFKEQKGLSLTAGPFCNITNPWSVQVMKDLGFSQAIVNPELGKEDFLALPSASPLPLGVVIKGYWPAGITRHAVDPLKPGDSFTSPKGERFWSRKFGQNIWLYPAWPLDISAHRAELERAGYSLFATLNEHPPKDMPQHTRTSEFNWDIGVL